MARSGIDALLHQPSLTHGSFQFRVIGGARILLVAFPGQSRQVTFIEPFLDQVCRLHSHLVSSNSLGQHKGLAAPYLSCLSHELWQYVARADDRKRKSPLDAGFEVYTELCRLFTYNRHWSMSVPHDFFTDTTKSETSQH